MFEHFNSPSATAAAGDIVQRRCGMLLKCTVLVLLSVVCLLDRQAAAVDVRRPPSIVTGPTRRLFIFRNQENIRLDCVASGVPDSIEYEWLHNGQPLNLNSDDIQRNPYDGTIEIRQASVRNEGYYQCLASNQWGTARSDTAQLKRAVLTFGHSQDVRNVTVEIGSPFVIDISSPFSYPHPPTFEWETAVDTVDKAPTKLLPSRRMQIDEHGNLHFAYATMEDALTNRRIYKCVVINPYLDLKSGGHYTRVTVQGSGNPQPFAPRLAFITESNKVVVEGKDMSLRCYFSGYPDPKIIWKFNGRQVQGGRFSLSNYDSELTVRNVEQSDEGEYTCSASNTQSGGRPIERRITVIVQAAPEFRLPNLLPRDLNATEGDSVSLYCGAYAEPAVDVVWMQNGKELHPDSLPPKFRLSKDHRNLTIVNVCKDCGHEKSDLQVIQCNASNVHGYAFAAGYLNVLSRTVILDNEEIIEEEIASKDEGRFVFECRATSDDSTPVSVRWDQIDQLSGESIQQMHNESNRVILGRDGSLTIQLPANDTEGWDVYGGTYRCRASNGYSQDDRFVRIIVAKTEPPAGRQEPVAVASILDLWWIFVIIAAVLLFFIILMCCCFCYQRNKGDTYPVDEKERQNGNNPEKELLDSGFHNYHRPSEDPMRGSQASLADSWPKLNHNGLDADQCSLDEYGDPEIGKFTEDGSFVGAYTATNERKNRGRNGSTGNY